MAKKVNGILVPEGTDVQSAEAIQEMASSLTDPTVGVGIGKEHEQGALDIAGKIYAEDVLLEGEPVASHMAESAKKHIAESGSNNDGFYLKFDDGTMICWEADTETISPIQQPNGLYLYLGIVRSYPQPFVAYYPVLRQGGSGAEIIGVANYTNTFRNYRPMVHLTTGKVSERTVDMYAVGRWK
ncbi:MAG TPA: hypothetical protein VFF56_01365 [Bacillota bacterium]|nr:hypothetical protein [Bacillota bacterium]